MSQEITAGANARRVSTEAFANRNHVKPGTVIKRLCLTGSYHGTVPVKLLNGRWDWPDVTVAKSRKATGEGAA